MYRRLSCLRALALRRYDPQTGQSAVVLSSLDFRVHDHTTLSLWRLADHFLFALIEVEHPAFAIRLHAHTDGHHRFVSSQRVKHRLLASAHAAQEVLHVILARLAVDLCFGTAELLLKCLLCYLRGRDGDGIDLTFEAAVGNHHYRSLVPAYQPGYVSLV